jgi:hypothetical protein
MGYEDEFYRAENIIGYTGDINNKPTVYFQTTSQYGRITQAHPKVDNIGRNKVRSIAADNYTWKNVDVPGKGKRMVEYRNGQKFHTSRNFFIEVTDETRDLLAAAITTYENAKSKYPKNEAEPPEEI